MLPTEWWSWTWKHTTTNQYEMWSPNSFLIEKKGFFVEKAIEGKQVTLPEKKGSLVSGLKQANSRKS